jgi:hypothetical protein
MAHHLSHHDPIFLLHKALVAFLIGAPSREGDLLTNTICGNFFVDELPTVIGIDSQNGKWKQRAGTLGRPSPPLALD